METDFVIVKPSEGYKILNPDTMQKILVDGTRVRKGAYWDRLEAEGAITVEAEKKPEPTPEPKPSPEPSKDEAKK